MPIASSVDPAPREPGEEAVKPEPDTIAVPEPAPSTDAEPASDQSTPPRDPPASGSPPPSTGGTPTATASQTPPDRTVRVSPASGSTAPEPTEQTGTLDVNSLPWAHISVDGAQRGRTWQKNLSLSVGSHELLLRTAGDREYRTTVTIPAAGEIARVCWDFDLEESCLR